MNKIELLEKKCLLCDKIMELLRLQTNLKVLYSINPKIQSNKKINKLN